ncbi:uncharacterized protein H6S33_012318 [Morchella sextelata]|uniref:uncharacterized protein n=1 Tax=Morchella sextelata TaxID=1174677 RepID=UPI001D04DEA7|nr:uncharacterized protein H6S33_012318 [Morchella sextelata]KAH0609772.1 hypothetical protein H6S33_012318 [Morchella sextelata]
MDIWSGSISVESSSASANIVPLEDLRLSTPSSTTTPSSVLSHLTSSLSSARLSALSIIDPTRIPLYLAAGPSLELTTTSPATASYFRKLFLSTLPTDDTLRTTTQSRAALLVRITNDTPAAPGSWKLTELVIYAAITHLPPQQPLLTTTTADLTPPNSSPPADATAAAPTVLVTVHALPLSSHHAFLIYMAVVKPHAEPLFIAPNPQEILNPSISQSAKKRGAAVLDAAADPRKRAKRSVQPQPPQPPPLTLLGGAALNHRKMSVGGGAAGAGAGAGAGVMVKRERTPSPAPSLSVNRSFGSGGGSGGGRGLKRSESSATMRSAVGAVARKEVYGEVETRNRAELAKVVVAGMRACGLKDYRGGRGRSIVGVEDDEEGEREREREREKEEYKQVYYHTVKAAAFALRNVIAAGTVGQDRMRDVVDRLLAVFCEPRTGQLMLEAAAAQAADE